MTSRTRGIRTTTNEAPRAVETVGKRTGISIYSQEIVLQANGLEDPDAFFSNAASPPQKENDNNFKMARFSLGAGQQADDASATVSTGTTRRMMGRIRDLTSPSELSRVSTAPPSPSTTTTTTNTHRQHQAAQSPESPPHMPVQNDYSDDDNDDVNMEHEEEEEARALVEQDSPLPHQDEDDNTPLTQQDDEEDIGLNQEATFPDNTSVVEDDFMPPGPPDSPERDDESEIPTEDAYATTQMSDDDDDADDDDGPGYSMPTTKTPQSAKMVRKDLKKTKNTETKSTKKGEKKKETKKRKVQVDSPSDNEDESGAKPLKKKKVKKSRFATVFSPKGIPLPLEYENIPVEDLQQKTPPEGVRRSKRARTAPLAFWKNEKPLYGPAGDDMDLNSDVANMPVVKAFVKAKETPYKPRPVRTRVVSASAKKKGKQPTISVVEEPAEPVPFDSQKLRKKYRYADDEELPLWDDATEESKEMKVVSFKSRVQARKLPVKPGRTKAEGNISGLAAQAFNVPQAPDSDYVGYIMGNLTLPPKGIKDAESVGSCAQTFTVVTGQPGSIEVAYADPDDDAQGAWRPESATRILLSPGDMFRVPPGNCYRLQNHSRTTESLMTWTIIRPYVARESS